MFFSLAFHLQVEKKKKLKEKGGGMSFDHEDVGRSTFSAVSTLLIARVGAIFSSKFLRDLQDLGSFAPLEPEAGKKPGK